MQTRYQLSVEIIWASVTMQTVCQWVWGQAGCFAFLMSTYEAQVNGQRSPKKQGSTEIKAKLAFVFFFLRSFSPLRASLVAQIVKNLLQSRRTGSIPGSERFPGEGNGNPPQYFCLENPMERSLVGYSPRGRIESDTTERARTHTHPT